MGLRVDTARMAQSLERGIGTTETLAAGLPENDRLRYPVCGLVATAIHGYAQSEGFESQLLISSPHLPFDEGMRHIIPVIKAPEGPVVIDAAPSQFLDYAGISPHYEQKTGRAVLPPEKVLVFDLDNPYLAVHWLVKSVRRFRESPIQKEALGMRSTPLLTARENELEETYTRIWDPANMEPWKISDDLLDVGSSIIKTLPKGLIRER